MSVHIILPLYQFYHCSQLQTLCVHFTGPFINHIWIHYWALAKVFVWIYLV